jgi:DivIVA domain-containing protein
VAGARITPEEVQQVEFRLAFRGYNERDVDAFLDRITEDLSAYIADGQGSGRRRGTAARRRGRAGPGRRAGRGRRDPAPCARGRREHPCTAAPAARPRGTPRAAVAPFLNSEREFLQSLGTLVQTHAEEIKQMVVALRSRAEATAQSPPARAVPERPEPA